MLCCKTNSLIAFFKLVLKKWKLALTITTFFFLRWKKSKTFFYHLISSLSNKIQIIVIWKSNFKQQNKFAFQTKPIHVTLHKKWTQGKKTPKNKFKNTLTLLDLKTFFFLLFSFLRNNMVLVAVAARNEKTAENEIEKTKINDWKLNDSKNSRIFWLFLSRLL